MSEYAERIKGLRAYLLGANFHEDEYSCSLYLEDSDECIPSTFNEDIEDEIANALRHLVYVIGIATEGLENKALKDFHIVQLYILDGDEKYSPEFLEKALEDYRAENDILANFRQSWLDVKEGRTYPISQLWDMVDEDLPE